MRSVRGLFGSFLGLTILAIGVSPSAAAPEGQMTWAVHISLAPTWFDPAETSGIITPFMVLYALHDSVLKPMPGNPLAPSLAESWSMSPDGLVYRFVSFTPGVELVLEAFDQYWRKTPHVKRLVLRVIPDHATRLAALKRGDADVVYLISGELAGEVRRTPGLTLKAVFPSNHWLILADQWDPKSPWHDKRVRLAANLAIDRHTLNDAATLGLSKITGSIVPSSFDFYWPAPAYDHDPARARRLLAEAGYANGFDAGEFFCDLQVCSWGEAMLTDLKAVGIQLRLRPLERAAFFKGVAEKRYRNLVYLFLGASGNAATWLETHAVSGGTYAYGGYPDIDGLFREQAAELDRAKRETILHRMQQLIHERAMFAPVWDFAFLHGVGPRVEESGLGLVGGYGFSAPYEDVKLKGK